MIVVAELKKPCTDKARADFIVENNHQKGYKINETKIKIQALSYDNLEKFKNAKTAKLNELNTIASQYDSYKCKDMYITSSVGGYQFNADIRSQTNLQGLISVLDDVKTVAYKDYDNEFQSLTKEQMQIILSECILNSQNLYKQKWDYKTQIENTQTIEELNKIVFKFEMKDFSQHDPMSV